VRPEREKKKAQALAILCTLVAISSIALVGGLLGLFGEASQLMVLKGGAILSVSLITLLCLLHYLKTSEGASE